MTFLSCLVYWNLLSFRCECESISYCEVLPGRFLLALDKFQLLENHLLRDDKLSLNQSRSGLCIKADMLTQRHKVLESLSNVFSFSAKNYI